MLPFITPFEVVKETIDGEKVTSLVYEDVNVNHNTIRPVMAYEICNNTNDFENDNVVPYASGHEVDISKEFQLVFWNNDTVTFFIHEIWQYNNATDLPLSCTVRFNNVFEICTMIVTWFNWEKTSWHESYYIQHDYFLGK